MADKIYLRCSAKARTTQYGDVLNLGIKVEDLADFCRKHKNERGYLNLTIAARKEVGQYGDTHSVYLDTYTPKSDGRTESVTLRSTRPVVKDDIPF